MKRATTYLIFAALLVLPTTLKAEVGSSINSVTDIETNVESATEVVSDSNLIIDTNTKVDGGVMMKNTNTSMKGDSKTNIEVNNSTKSESNMNTKTSSDSDMTLGLELNAAGIAVKSSTQVNSEADLRVYENNILISNKNVAKLKTEVLAENETKVEVKYRHKGKLLGLIPVTVKSKTTVQTSTNGEVTIKVKKSWWSFLVAGESVNSSDLKSRMGDNTTIKVRAKVNASAKVKAEIAEAIIAEIETYMSAQASVNAG